MDSGWFPVVTVIGNAAVTAGALIWNTRLSANAKPKDEVRGQRRVVYLEFLTQARDMSESIRRALRAEAAGDDVEEQLPDFERLADAVEALKLFGSHRVARAGEQLVDEFKETLGAIDAHSEDPTPASLALEAADRAGSQRSDILRLMRDDLEVEARARSRRRPLRTRRVASGRSETG